MNALSLTPEAYAFVAAAAHRSYPEECCGFLIGNIDERTDRTISHVLPAANAAEGDRKKTFAIAASDYIRAERFALAHSATLLGIYHSHPSYPAIPSLRDLAAAQPAFSYLILSCFPDGIDHVRSWRLSDTRPTFIPEMLRLSQTKN